MSLKAVIEFVLHIQSYHIIEYPHQGFFSFHSSIYQLKENKKNHAIPYQILNNTHPLPKYYFSRIITEPNLDDERAISSVGLAKYSDEIITMDNWFTLRMQLQGYPMLQSDNLFIEIEFRLNHKDISCPQVLGNIMETVTFRLNDLENGIFNYAEAHFKSPYVSTLNFTIFSFISNFKFAKYQCFEKELDKYERKRVKISTLQELVDFAQSQHPKMNIENIFYSTYIKKLRISQYLIQDRINTVRLEAKQIQIKVPKEFIQKTQYQQITSKEFKQYLDKYEPQAIKMEQIMMEINQISQENFHFIRSVTQEWMNQQFNHQKLIEQFKTFGQQKYGQMVFKSTVNGAENSNYKQQKSYHQNKKIAQEMRNKNVILVNYPVEDVRFQSHREEQELIFYQLAYPQNKESQNVLLLPPQQQAIQMEGTKIQYAQKHMLIVLCHGYQGSGYDMTLIKRWIQLQLPDAYYLIARSNEDNTDGDMKLMGKNLAEEIEKYISNYMEEYEQENVIINLVGHSMGGIIARAALPHLDKYKKQMGFYCSLSTPHLGYLNGVSGLIKVGLWAIRKFKNIESLSQLSMEQKGDPRKTFLYQLSSSGHLRHFRRIILLSSYQDTYVSWHSARISSHRSNNSLSKIQQQMCRSLLENNLFGATIHRLDINFNVKQKNLDSFIGRTAHINLIIRQNLFKTLNITIPKLFDLTEFGRKGLFL